MDDGSVQPMVCRQKGKIDAHGGGGGPTVSPPELPVPSHKRLHISPKITPSLTPSPCIVLQQPGQKSQFALLCRERFLLHWLGRTVFGTIWQEGRTHTVSGLIYTQLCRRTLVRPSLAISSDTGMEGPFLLIRCTSLWESSPIHQSLSRE